MLPFDVALRPGLAPFREIVFAATKAIVSGGLVPGDPFPSVRELSAELKINPNTAQKVVAELIRTGMLEVRAGIGTVVADAWREDGAQQQQQQALLSPELERLAVEAKRIGLSRSALLDALARQWDTLFGTGTRGRK